MKDYLRFFLCAGIAAGASLAGCGAPGTESASQMTSFSSQPGKEAVPTLFSIPAEQMAHIQVVTVATSRIPRILRLTGAVAYNAFSTTPVISQIGGPVSRILVVPGEIVKQGQPLLSVTSPDYALLRAGYLKARDTFRVADKNFDRAKDLYEHHAIAERDMLQAESDRNQAQADLQASEQGLRILGIPKPEGLAEGPVTSEVPVLAPIAGEVVERLVSPGQLLTPGATQAFTISDMRTVWVLVNVYQADLSEVKVGDAVTLQTDAYPDVFHGRISFIAPALDPTTRTLQARIVVDNPQEKLKKDMYVTATVSAGSDDKALAVPDAAILRDDENMPFVYVANSSNQFGRRMVQIGNSQDGNTRVSSGLSIGDRVVGNGALFLQFENTLQH